MEVRFHLDENVNGAVANGLRLRDIDVTTTPEAGLIGASDEEQLAHALAERRVIITHDDDDFLRLHAENAPHAGIVYCAPRRYLIGWLVRGLSSLWRSRTQEEMMGQVVFL